MAFLVCFDRIRDLPLLTCHFPQWQLYDLFQVQERIGIDMKRKIFLQQKLVINTTLGIVTAYLSYFPWRASKCYQWKAWESCVVKNLWDWENIIASLCKNGLLELLLPRCLRHNACGFSFSAQLWHYELFTKIFLFTFVPIWLECCHQMDAWYHI